MLYWSQVVEKSWVQMGGKKMRDGRGEIVPCPDVGLDPSQRTKPGSCLSKWRKGEIDIYKMQWQIEFNYSYHKSTICPNENVTYVDLMTTLKKKSLSYIVCIPFIICVFVLYKKNHLDNVNI